MKENIGDRDRSLRLSIGLFLIVLGVAGYTGALPVANVIPQAFTSVALSIIGIILVLTGYFRRCLLYRAFGVDTWE